MRALVNDVEDFLLVHPDVAPGALGWKSVRDKDLVKDLRGGRVPWARTAERVRAWMAQHAREAEKLSSRRDAARRRLARLHVAGPTDAAP